MSSKSNIEIYQTEDGESKVEVTFDEETVWLNQEQLSFLFERDRTVIGRHIRNIFKEGELVEELVCANFAHTTQHGAIKGKTQSKNTRYYNLDVIISVGYRVKSVRGTQFRQWASQRLKEHLIQGYTANLNRLKQTKQEIQILRSGIKILGRAIEQKAAQQGSDWLNSFSQGLTLLDDYDHENLDQTGLTKRSAIYPTEEEYYALISEMKSNFRSEIFGIEKDHGFKSAINQVSKGIGNSDFYPTLEEKAATLLYLTIKNHAFTDGNKRIGAACFLLFLEKNNMLTNSEGIPIISNEALASITLLIAASKPEEMDLVKRLIVSVLNRNKTRYNTA